MAKRKRSRDPNQLAKMIVDMASGESPKTSADKEAKNPNAVALGRLGGLKGGPSRALSLSAERRKQIAKKAAKKRWSRESSDG